MINAGGEIFDAIDFDGGAAFEEEIAVGGFLAGDGIDDEQRAAECEGFRCGESAGFGDDEIGDGHELVDILDVAEEAGGVTRFAGGELLAKLGIVAGDDDELEEGGDPFEGVEDFGDWAESESAAKDEQDGEIIAEAHVFAEAARVEGLSEVGGDGDAGDFDFVGVDAASDEAGAGFVGGDAVEVDDWIQPEGMSLEVGDDAGGEGRGWKSGDVGHDFDGQIMGAEDGVRLELAEEFDEASIGGSGEGEA